MSANLAPKIERLDRNPRPPIKGRDQVTTNLLKTEDQAIHATKMALTKIPTQPRQQPCPQNISADGQAADNAARIPIMHITSVDLKTT